MRSRFSAYALGLWQYLYDTGPQTGSAAEEIHAMADWCADKTWLALKILRTRAGGPADSQGEVEFAAFYRNNSNGKLEQHHEHSQFEKRDGLWRFIAGQGLAELAIGRNEPCPCGSGKKFKRCCAG